MPYFHFSPDLIIEVTRLCDRGCRGCYAPNVVGKRLRSALGNSHAGLHVLAADVTRALEDLQMAKTLFPISVAIRGGEPSLHPNLSAILAILAQRARPIYLETHGRWLGVRDEHLLETCVDIGVILKISFDAMHLISVEELKRICGIADGYGASWLVAITETTESEIQKTRGFCHWIPDERIVLQYKADHISELIQPRLGVLTPNGVRASRLSVRPEFFVELGANSVNNMRVA